MTASLKNIKIYEIQSIVEHELLEANEYAIAQEYINYRTKRDFERSQATDINFTISKLVNKRPGCCSRKMLIKIAIFTIHNVI